MGILAKVGEALQRLFGDIAQTAADESGVIRRKRKFTALSLARTFVLGFLQKPNASDEELAQIAVQCGAAVAPRLWSNATPRRLVTFLEKLFRGATALVAGSGRALATLLKALQPGDDPGQLHDHVARRDAGAVPGLWRQPRRAGRRPSSCRPNWTCGKATCRRSRSSRAAAPTALGEAAGRAARRVVADHRPRLFLRGGVRRDCGREGVFPVALAVRDRGAAGRR